MAKRNLKAVFFSLLLFLVIACKITYKEHYDKTQDNLSYELCQIYGFDQGIRDTVLTFNKRKVMPEIDSVNFVRIISFIRKNGFPNEKLLGKRNFSQECVESSAVAVLLHNPQRIVKDKNNFYLLLTEVNKGNMKRDFFATVLDKYYWAKKGNNRKVYYGTPFGKPCIEEKRVSDSLRKEIGLNPLDDSSYRKCSN
ncbi:hypothetical protein BAX94_01865 [Elizabethkingia meningoseptica]|uniref:Lipoprotein n=1 Tax=Elizabethkingia meningoseptica TaxID=238 RepID=A0A1V3TXQ0_ELIME|nr:MULTISPECIES: hypothetical protein [Elizabethkingia]AQX12497.1 hypothetical protein BBD35_08995 [Elizabethkingia meningoseptica]MBG0514040.1 hypothetical protein [Elizabethkingia meningoseptica]MDE5432955.1 hypothetical protein [Elizabethkingia meningoseptica]MDE5449360.1 hypothetical protein [Elizabethkingia meningoseptica]MDE5471614.1 hypothetical protein [Elizabethkingia meningoseptica]